MTVFHVNDPRYDMRPLISCIMPTKNRRAFVPQAIRAFLRQDYSAKELLIVDDGSDSVADLVPNDPQVRYIRLDSPMALGAKRNRCIELAHGDLIMHWDDDDWYASDRITIQYDALRTAGAEICGLREMLFFDPATATTWLYSYPPRARPWLAGGSLLYSRELWRRAPFPDVPAGEDTRFVWERDLRGAAIIADYRWYVACIHPSNTSTKQRNGACWRRWDGDLRSVVGDDYVELTSRHAVQPSTTHPAPNRRTSTQKPTEAQKPDCPTHTMPAPTGHTLEGSMRLNLGCYDNPLNDYVNVGPTEAAGVVAADLRQAWPWPDGAAEHVRAADFIEHLPDKIHTMNELWRVLAPGGTAEISVPTTDGSGAFQDPTHVSFWNRRSFLYYEDGNAYRERFARFYGIQARFRIVREQTERTIDGPRLTIVLQAVKS